MAMYSRKMDALTCFFVFNPTLGNDDDDSDRILYFFPSNKFNINRQCGYIGLVSGLVNFAKFSIILWVESNKENQRTHH